MSQHSLVAAPGPRAILTTVSRSLQRDHFEHRRLVLATLGTCALIGGLSAPLLLPPPAGPKLLLLGLGVAAVIVGFVSLTLLATIYPIVALAVSGAVLYNPLFNLRFLYLEEFRGGSVRASVSIVIMICLLIALFLRDRPSVGIHLLAPLRPRHLLFLGLVGLGLLSGLIWNNALRLIASDLFPVCEFTIFYLLGSKLITANDEGRRLVRWLIGWATVAALLDLLLYVFAREVFLSHFALAGSHANLVRRIDDFMPALVLPLVLSAYLFEGKRRPQLMYMASGVILAGAIALSFFRSLYAGIGVAVAAIVLLAALWPGPPRRSVLIRLVTFAGVSLVLAASAGSLVIKTIAFSKSLSIVAVVTERIRFVESTSGSARIVDNMGLLGIIAHHPLIGVGLGGKEGSLPLFSTSNYYLSLAAELGIPALLILLWIAIKFMLSAIKAYRRYASEENRPLALGIIGSFVSVAVTLLTFPALLHFPIPMYLAILAASLYRLHGGDRVKAAIGLSVVMKDASTAH